MISSQTKTVLSGNIDGILQYVIPIPSIRPHHFIYHEVEESTMKVVSSTTMSYEEFVLFALNECDSDHLTKEEVNKFLNSLNLKGI